LQNFKKAAVVVKSNNNDIHVYKESRRIATIFDTTPTQIPKELPPGSVWYNRLVAR